MKKLMIASAIAMTMAAGSAMAASQNIQFTGSITATTCDLVVDGNASGLINLVLQRRVLIAKVQKKPLC